MAEEEPMAEKQTSLKQVGWRSRRTGEICDCPVTELSPHANSEPVFVVGYAAERARLAGEMPNPPVYGAKCHVCTHLLGPTHNEEPIAWLEVPGCKRCEFCQARALMRTLNGLDLGYFDPEVQAAVHAFHRHEAHPLLDQLRDEMS